MSGYGYLKIQTSKQVTCRADAQSSPKLPRKKEKEKIRRQYLNSVPLERAGQVDSSSSSIIKTINNKSQAYKQAKRKF